jgi:hypothetical protein
LKDFVGMNFAVDFTAAAVPEPGTLVLMAVGTTFGAICGTGSPARP